jgi:L-asparaginase
MTGRLRFVAIALGLILVTAVSAAAKPRVAIVATGGTIAGAQPNTAQGGYTSGVFDIQHLIDAAPLMKDLADIKGEQLVNVGSQDMTNEIWLKLGHRVDELLKQPDVDAVVITHGTDTMEETGYFLSLTVHSDKPIVMVGSMRPATSLSADGPMNLYEAVAVATSPEAKGRGVMVVLNDQIHYAREVEKQNTTALDTFHSPNRGPAGHVSGEHVTFFAAPARIHGDQSAFSIAGLDALPKVEIIYAYANVGRDFIDYAVKNGAKGIVVAGVGDGNMTQAATDGLADAARGGVAVVRSSRTGSGAVYRNIEVDDDKLHFIASGELNPQKSRVLLMLGLLKSNSVDALQQYFDAY